MLLARFIIVAGIFLVNSALGFDLGWVNPPDTAEQIKSYGYTAEVHYVITSDGYVLKMFRIPSGKKATMTHKPLLLMHGLMCSSDCWTLAGPNRSLAFFLADRGYDVWLGNTRGNQYSASHMTIPSDDPKLWDYGFHEMGIYDLPAMVDYILEKTGEPSLSYVGHSQGSTVFFIMASMLPEYQDKIKVASALAPVAYLDHTKGLVRRMALLSKLLVTLTTAFGYHSVMHNHIYIRLTGQFLCRDDFFLGNVCSMLFSQLGGTDHFDGEMALQVIKYCPTGASIKQLRHFSQLAENGGQFKQFDYGTVQNLVNYGSILPPDYPIENIKTPILLYSSDTDNFATMPEVLRLQRTLPNLKGALKLTNFSHLDFMWGANALVYLYEPTINEMVIFR